MQPQPRRRFPIGTFLFLLFTGFTLLEIWLIMLLAQVTSIPFTILVVIVSAIVGSAMAKQQGLATIAKAQSELQRGRFPAGPLADGVMILIGGALLITPGLVTDVFGFSTLVPVCRKFYARHLIRWAKKHIVVRSMGPGMGGGMPPGANPFGGGEPGQRPPRGGTFDAPPGSYQTNDHEPPRRSAPVDEDKDDAVDVEFRRID